MNVTTTTTLTHLQSPSSSSTSSSSTSSPVQSTAIGPTILATTLSRSPTPPQPTSIQREQKTYKITHIQASYRIWLQENEKNFPCTFLLACPIFVKQNICYVKGNVQVQTKEPIPTKKQARTAIEQDLKLYKRPYNQPLPTTSEEIHEWFKHSRREALTISVNNKITPLLKGKGYQIPFEIEFTFAAAAVSRTNQSLWTLKLFDQILLEDILVEKDAADRDEKINLNVPLDKGEDSASWADKYQEARDKKRTIVTRLTPPSTDEQQTSSSTQSTQPKRKSSSISNSTSTSSNSTSTSQEEEFDSPAPKRRANQQPSSRNNALSPSSTRQAPSSSSTSSESTPLQTAREKLGQIQDLASHLLNSLQTDQQAIQEKERENTELRTKLKKANATIKSLEEELKQERDKTKKIIQFATSLGK